MITTVGRSRPILLENGDDYVAAFQKAMGTISSRSKPAPAERDVCQPYSIWE
jgi:hypothetical protein